MSFSRNETNDRDLLDGVAEAFAKQPIPPRPTDVQTLERIKANEPQSLITSQRSNRSSVFAAAASIPVIAIGAAMGVAIWRMDSQTDKTKSVEAITTEIEAESRKSFAQQQMVPPESKFNKTEPEDNGEQETKKSVRTVEPAKIDQRTFFVKFCTASEIAELVKPLLTNPAAEIEVDERFNAVVVRSTVADLNFVQRAIEKSDSKLAPSRKSLLSVVHLLNRCWARGICPSDSIARELRSHLPAKSVRDADLKAALDRFGMPKGVKAVVEQVHERYAWIHSANDHLFTYELDLPQLFVDAKQYVDFLLGDVIFDDLLDGIRDDEAGPRIDLRQIAKTLGGQMMLVVRRGQIEDRVMLVIPLTDVTGFASGIERFAAVEPNHTETSFRGTSLYVLTAGKYATAICVVDRCLVIGEATMVRESIARRF